MMKKGKCLKIVVAASAIMGAFFCPLGLADTVPLNGDFSAGLSDWTLEYGTVSGGGGYALFQEDPFDLSSTLSQQFEIPALALELSFDVTLSAVAGGDDFGFPADAFTGSLLDPANLDPLVSNSPFPDFYYLDNTGWEDTVGAVIGSTVILDVSSLRGRDALLSFDLWSGSDGIITAVSLDNVSISVVPLPSALMLGLTGIGTGALGFSRRFAKTG